MPIPQDYLERVYAGVLGKIIGVYLGRPFEGWPHDRILKELGEINYYVHEKLNLPLIVTDDDISGTFTFLRALEDYGNSPNLTAAQIGQSWLNYIIENKTILWWGGMGMSTEHTAFLRLKHGIPAPRSGSIELNSKVVAEQIGAQIFIDGFAMVAPGDPQLAASLAKRAASVSHDGQAVYGAQVLAAMESLAFVESDLSKILDAALTFIPKDSTIARMIADLRGFHAKEPDWRKAFSDIMLATYGYDRYGGNCHIVPNHGVVILGILYSQDNFQKALMITNTCGWDTDCNSGNVGCFMGIKLGLPGIDAGPDFRSPVADRLYLPTADGGRCISDAVTETYKIVNMGRALAGQEPLRPKGGVRFHFSLPGSVQGFTPDDSPECRGVVTVCNLPQKELGGQRALMLFLNHLAPGRCARISTPTFFPADHARMPGYALIASPTLYPGQVVRASVSLDPLVPADPTLDCRLYISIYAENDALRRIYGPTVRPDPSGSTHPLEWRLPDTGGAPIASIGLEIGSEHPARCRSVLLHYLTWDGPPDVVFKRPEYPSTMWQRAWVDSGQCIWWSEDTYRLISNEQRTLLSQGTREWTDYVVSAPMTPHLAKSFGVVAHYQGLQRFYALLLCPDNTAKLIKSLDGDHTLAQCHFDWQLTKTYNLALQVQGTQIQAWIDNQLLFTITDNDRPLSGGGVALFCEEGRVAAGPVTVRPIQ
ncbi:MAG: ADP-ribosylglycohydrolase family protein [Planctomycetota bacterium]|nr:ADP-ribosylglycohydrolase family protein [Planctomycetota bacterium]